MLLLILSSFVLGVNFFVYAVSVVCYIAAVMVCFDGWDEALFCILFYVSGTCGAVLCSVYVINLFQYRFGLAVVSLVS